MCTKKLQVTRCDYLYEYSCCLILSSIKNAVIKVVKSTFLLFLLCSIIINSTTTVLVFSFENVSNNNNTNSIISSSPRANYDESRNLYSTDGVVAANTEATFNDPVTERISISPFTSNEYYVLKNDDDDTGSKNPSEIQKAVCTVSAGEVRASAEAVTTKVLKGVCGSVEMNLALRNLEIKLLSELDEIKTLLKQQLKITKVESSSTKTARTANTLDAKKIDASSSLKETVDGDDDAANFLQKAKDDNKDAALKSAEEVTDATATTAMHGPKLKSLSRWRTTNAREHEVLKFNNTMLSDRDLKVFTFYWKLENVSEHFTRGSSSKTLESPSFSIKGKLLRIKAHYHHMQRDFLYLQLVCGPLNASRSRNNIFLDTGSLFKKIADDNIQFKYKILILDQNNKHAQDLISQEFTNLETGFLVPNSALLASSYVKNNSLLIQVFLYL